VQLVAIDDDREPLSSENPAIPIGLRPSTLQFDGTKCDARLAAASGERAAGRIWRAGSQTAASTGAYVSPNPISVQASARASYQVSVVPKATDTARNA
jgi:hypothetical protein